MSAKSRVNITIDAETLRIADRVARRRNVSRSELIRTAIRQSADAQIRQDEAEARRKRQREAIKTMDRLARKAGKWPATEILRQWRYRSEEEH
jgi:metal-responsive CopG/Arc/MetJ family transcriptional regulator